MVTLAQGLKRRGHEIEFFIYALHYRHFVPNLESVGVPIHEHGRSNKYSLGVVRKLRQLMRNGRFDACLAFLDTPNLYSEIASLRLAEVKLVVSERSAYPSGRLSFLKRVFQNFHRRADHITVNSHHQRERMIQEFPWMEQKISTIYNGVDLDFFRPPSVPLPSRSPLRLICIGTVARKKNVHGLVEALRHFRDQWREGLRVDWAGKFPDAAYHQELSAAIERYGLEAHWGWLGEVKDIHQRLHAYDGVIHPSFYEGLPNAVCEGLASGCPVLASNIGDHARLVGDDNGFLFDPKDPEDIARAMHQFVSLSDEARREMGNASREQAERLLAMQHFIDNYERLFRSLTGNVVQDGSPTL